MLRRERAETRPRDLSHSAAKRRRETIKKNSAAPTNTPIEPRIVGQGRPAGERENEADPRLGTISYYSPLARSLIGRRVGDLVDVDGHEIELVAID